MKVGVYLRNMGPQSTRATIAECARLAEAAGIDDLWVADHIAIPPDDAAGSNGRYLDPLATLAFLAGTTERINLGTGVLVLPYRPPLATAKWVATVQELSGGRFLLGVGVGWMEAEFRALGVDRRRRGSLTDQTLEFIHRCFSADEVEEHGQRFLFRPRPRRPPVFVGGKPEHAFRRIIRFGDGWMPMGSDPETLRPAIARLHELSTAAGRPVPEVVLVTALPMGDMDRAIADAQRLAAVGVTRIVHGSRYADAKEFGITAERLGSRVIPALPEMPVSA